jgi:uncharacterized glyoxalase superfamily protein PhnB
MYRLQGAPIGSLVVMEIEGPTEVLTDAAVMILKTTDVAATIAWYRLAGFELRAQAPEVGEPTWCELARDGLVVQFLGGDTPWEGPPALTGSLYLYPVDVDAVYADVKDTIRPEWGIEERDWGTRELVLRDPNGYFVTFCEPR